MKKLIIFCLFYLTLNVTAYCGQLSKIELADGSVINGEIVSFVNGVYTINTPALGEVKLGLEKVSKIESANYVSSSASANPVVQGSDSMGSQVSAYGQTLMKNPENVAIVSGLANNSRLAEMVKDPQLQNAAKTGDIQSLLKNPKFMDIVNSPEVQEAVKKFKQ